MSRIQTKNISMDDLQTDVADHTDALCQWVKWK